MTDERKKEYYREYYIKHRDKIIAYAKAYNKAHPTVYDDITRALHREKSRLRYQTDEKYRQERINSARRYYYAKRQEPTKIQFEIHKNGVYYGTVSRRSDWSEDRFRMYITKTYPKLKEPYILKRTVW